MKQSKRKQRPPAKEPVAGRSLDVLVAEKLLGYRWEDWETGQGFYAPDGAKVAKRFKKDGMRLVICDVDGSECVPTRPLPRLSTSIKAAWKVMEALRRRFGMVQIFGCDDPKNLGAKDEETDLTYWECQIGDEVAFASAGTPALAICRAALKMIEKEGA